MTTPSSAISSLPRSILLCLDGSPASEGCVPYAVSLAKTFECAVTLVRVVQFTEEQDATKSKEALDWEIVHQEARTYLERLQKEISLELGRPVDLRLEQGPPAQRIADLAHEISADLTVLASHGEESNFGQTAQRILALVRSSVFVVPVSGAARVSVIAKRILVPLDGSMRTESVLPTAKRLAHANGAELLLVHVVQHLLPSPLLDAADDIDLAKKLEARIEVRAHQYLEQLRVQLTKEHTSVRTIVVRHANANQGLIEISKKERSDLIVLSARGSACNSAEPFGGATAYLLDHSTVPMLVHQDLPAQELHGNQEVKVEVAAPPLRASFAPGA